MTTKSLLARGLRQLTSASEVLGAPISEWEERTSAAKDKQSLENELSALIQRAALLEAYISRRWNTGCGDQGHETSAKHANRRLVKIRRAMGFSYPDNLPVSIT
jgi:hypothetical protein